MEADGLAKKDRGGFVLVAARGELAEHAIRGAALRIETDDVAQIGLCFEITTQCEVSARANDQQWNVLGLDLERFIDQGHDARVVPRFEQLVCGRQYSAVHAPEEQQVPRQQTYISK